VLNSVNVSTTLIAEQLKKSKVATLPKVAALLAERAHDPKCFSEDERGKQLPLYLQQLAEHLAHERATSLMEVQSLAKNIEHIKEIVAMQQSYAKVSGIKERIKVN